MRRDDYLIFEAFNKKKILKEDKHCEYALKGCECNQCEGCKDNQEENAENSSVNTASKLADISSLLVNLKRKIELNEETPTAFSQEELKQDVDKAVEILKNIQYPY